MKSFKLFLKRLLCEHYYRINKWHWVHYPNHEPLSIEVEYICNNCGKVKYKHLYGKDASKWVDELGENFKVI